METLALDDGPEQLMTREKVAERLDCSEATVRRMESDGRFPLPLHIGNKPRWRERDVDAWIAARAASVRKLEAAAAKSVAPRKRASRV